jgi:hypothetical protein
LSFMAMFTRNMSLLALMNSCVDSFFILYCFLSLFLVVLLSPYSRANFFSSFWFFFYSSIRFLFKFIYSSVKTQSPSSRTFLKTPCLIFWDAVSFSATDLVKISSFLVCFSVSLYWMRALPTLGILNGLFLVISSNSISGGTKMSSPSHSS